MNQPHQPLPSSFTQKPEAIHGPMEQEGGIKVTLEALLKYPQQIIPQLNSGKQKKLIASFVGTIVFCALVYGIIVGTFSGGEQLWIAPLKIIIGIFSSTLICFPSLYIFACLSGVDIKISAASGLLCAALSLSSVLMLGFVPVAWIFSQSTNSIIFMGALHLAIWIISTCYGLRLLYHGITNSSGAGKLMHLRVWSIIFIIVGLQMTTALRPMIGVSSNFLPKEKKFFLSYWAECIKNTAAISTSQSKQ